MRKHLIGAVAILTTVAIGLSVLSTSRNKSRSEIASLQRLIEKNAVMWEEKGKRTIVVSYNGWEGRTSPWNGNAEDFELLTSAGPVDTLEIAIYADEFSIAESFDFLTRVRGLRALEIESSSKLSDNVHFISAIERCPSLEELRILGCKYSMAEFLNRDFARLTKLNIEFTEDTQSMIDMLNSFKSMTDLTMRGVCLDESQLLAVIEALPKLQSLRVAAKSETIEEAVRNAVLGTRNVSIEFLEPCNP